MIPYGRHNIDEDDVQAVCTVLRSSWLTQGPTIEAFENALTRFTNAEHAVAVSSGTAGLHMVCLALGLGEGDYLWTTPNSFVASANCGLYCGAGVEFVDIDPVTRNLCPDKLAAQLAQAKTENILPKIIVAVHFAGLPCDLKRLRELADFYGIYLVEDGAHAIGSRYLDSPVGSGEYSDATVFSFHPVKTLAAGEGGAVLTNDGQLAKRVRQLATHGVERANDSWQQPASSPCYYEQQQLGFNYRLSDIHAALGLSQLNKLDRFIDARRKIVARYNQAFEGLKLQLPVEPDGYHAAWHIYVVAFESAEKRNHCYQMLRDKGVLPNIHYIPIHQHPYYQSLPRHFGSQFIHAEQHYCRALTLPLFADLSERDQAQIIQWVRGAV
ncbi:MAG TPA: UDP-4-amino-4,6-dideoxy-N-acetyl-beta-L-altrosamine transaminase [Marinagarivorans sp.]